MSGQQRRRGGFVRASGAGELAMQPGAGPSQAAHVIIPTQGGKAWRGRFRGGAS